MGDPRHQQINNEMLQSRGWTAQVGCSATGLAAVLSATWLCHHLGAVLSAM